MRSILYPVLFLLDVLRASSFPLFLIYICLSFLRPIDIFFPEWLEDRPMLYLFLFAFVAGVLNAAHQRRFGMSWLHIALLIAFSGVIILSHLQFGQIGGAFTSALDFSSSAFIFVLAALNLVSIRRIRITGAVWLSTMIAATLLSLYAYYTGFHWQALVLQQAGTSMSGIPDHRDVDAVIPAEDTTGLWLWRIRGIAILSDPNDFAQVLVAVFPFIWTFAGQRPWAHTGTALHAIGRVVQTLMNRFKGSRFLFYAAPAASILLFGIYMTHSRGALLGLASLTFFIFLKRLGTTRTALLLMLGALAAAALNLGGGREMSMNESSAEDRISAWRLALDLLKGRPILGVGFNNFLEYNDLTAHNSFVLCFAELGLFGYFFWMALIVLAYLSVKRVLDRFPEESEAHHMAVLLRSSLLGYLTCAWFLSRSYSAGLFLLLGMCISVLFAARNDEMAALAKASRRVQMRPRDAESRLRTPASDHPRTAPDHPEPIQVPLSTRASSRATMVGVPADRRGPRPERSHAVELADRPRSATRRSGKAAARVEPRTGQNVVEDNTGAVRRGRPISRDQGDSDGGGSTRAALSRPDQLLRPKLSWVWPTLAGMMITIVAVQAIVSFAGLGR